MPKACELDPKASLDSKQVWQIAATTLHAVSANHLARQEACEQYAAKRHATREVEQLVVSFRTSTRRRHECLTSERRSDASGAAPTTVVGSAQDSQRIVMGLTSQDHLQSLE